MHCPLRPQYNTFVMACCALGLLLTPPGQAQATANGGDATPLVREMISTYQKATTFKESSEVHLSKGPGRDIVQTDRLQYKRPNLLLLIATDPVEGTVQSYCNGNVTTLYLGRANLYTHRKAPATLPLALKELSRSCDQMIGTPQYQVLSPLSFLLAKGLPVEARQFRYAGTQVVDGHNTFHVTSPADMNWCMSVFSSGAGVTFTRREVSLWIDKSSKLLIRASFDIAFKRMIGSEVTMGSVKYTETHRDIVLNGLMRDEEFEFVPPKGAVEKFQEGR